MCFRAFSQLFIRATQDITEYPVAELIVAAGFFVVLSLEQIVLGICVNGKQPPRKAKGHDNKTVKHDENLPMNGMGMNTNKDSPVFTNGQISDGPGEIKCNNFVEEKILGLFYIYTSDSPRRTVQSSDRSCVVML